MDTDKNGFQIVHSLGEAEQSKSSKLFIIRVNLCPSVVELRFLFIKFAQGLNHDQPDPN